MLAAGHVPEFYDPVCAGRGEERLIWSEGHAPDHTDVPGYGLPALAGACVPDAHTAILAGRGNVLAVLAEGDAGQCLGMAGQRVLDAPLRRVPDDHGMVLAAGRQVFAVRTVSHGIPAWQGVARGVALAFQVIPLEAAQIESTGFTGPLAVEQLGRPDD